MRANPTRAFFLVLLTGITGSICARTPGPNNAITDVPGINVGHFTGTNAGATVVLAASTTGQGVGGGVTQRGGSPGTRLTDLLKSEKATGTVHAISLSGGSAYGLAAADDVTTCLEGQGVGTQVGDTLVPIVPSALSRAIIRAIMAADGIHIGSCNVNSYCELFPLECAP